MTFSNAVSKYVPNILQKVLYLIAVPCNGLLYVTSFVKYRPDYTLSVNELPSNSNTLYSSPFSVLTDT